MGFSNRPRERCDDRWEAVAATADELSKSDWGSEKRKSDVDKMNGMSYF